MKPGPWGAYMWFMSHLWGGVRSLCLRRVISPEASQKTGLLAVVHPPDGPLSRKWDMNLKKHSPSREEMCLVGALRRSVIEWFTNSLIVRGWVHDSSKLEEPEKAAFDASGDEGCEVVRGRGGGSGPVTAGEQRRLSSPLGVHLNCI